MTNERYLFRGKRIENEEWIFGCLNILGKYAYIADSNRNWSEIIPETVGQYTGLKDKNGVKIFEGDKLRYNSSNTFSLGELRILEVSYAGSQYWCSGSKIGVSLRDLITMERVEVIGNIHEPTNK